MTNTDKAIAAAFEQLLSEGKEILNRCGWNGQEYQRHPGHDEYTRFRTKALNLVRRACGEDSDHYRELRRLADGQHSADNSYYFVHCFGIVEAAAQDVDAGLLFDVRRLVSAEVLDEFIEQAEVLLDAGYHVAATSLAGAVLEDALRRLCPKFGVAVPPATKLDRLNADLAKAGAYDKLVQKRITGIADLRNKADHGEFEKVNAPDVKDMVQWVRRFTTDVMH